MAVGWEALLGRGATAMATQPVVPVETLVACLWVGCTKPLVRHWAVQARVVLPAPAAAVVTGGVAVGVELGGQLESRLAASSHP